MTIAVADLLQVALLGKGWGALAGAALYLAIALGFYQRARIFTWIALFVPLLPTSILLGLLGSGMREAFVDVGMVVVYALQLGLGAVSATHLLYGSSPIDPDLG